MAININKPRPRPNSVLFSGRLAADPKVRTVNDGMCICSFVVYNTRWAGGDNYDESPVTVVTFGKRAENHGRQLKKGDSVDVQGSLTARSYRDTTSPAGQAIEAAIKAGTITHPELKEKGLQRARVEINASDVFYNGRPNANGQQNGQAQTNGSDPEPTPEPVGEIAF